MSNYLLALHLEFEAHNNILTSQLFEVFLPALFVVFVLLF